MECVGVAEAAGVGRGDNWVIYHVRVALHHVTQCLLTRLAFHLLFEKNQLTC